MDGANRTIGTRHTMRLVECQPRRKTGHPDPCVMVIVGASGDLPNRVITPARYNLSRTDLLPERFAIAGVARTEETAESRRRQLRETLEGFVGNAVSEFAADSVDESARQRLTQDTSYIYRDLTKPDVDQRPRDAIGRADKTCGVEGSPQMANRT